MAIAIMQKTGMDRQEGKVRATPAARSLAKKKDVDLVDIQGSGPHGRVQKSDVADYHSINEASLATKSAGDEPMALEGNGHGTKVIEEDLSLRVEPVTLHIEIDMTSVSALRTKAESILQKKTDKAITVTDVLIMATSKALMKYPLVNSTLVEEGIQVNEFVNMGIAVGTDKGFIVSVIRGADKMTLREIIEVRSNIMAKTPSGKVALEELKESTFTICHLGMYDITSFDSMINEPNSAILSVGTIAKRMRVIDDAPEVREVMDVGITLDHRVMDSLVGAQFLQYIKELIEDPSLLLI